MGGDLTQIGERGINLSGGQKQRVSIARAVYADADIYLIDDALSALDAHVGKKIMQNVFLHELSGKTRILVTHFISLLDKVDKVMFLQNKKVAEYGSLASVRQNQGFKDFTISNQDQEENLEDFEVEVEEKGLNSSEQEKISRGHNDFKLLTSPSIEVEMSKNEN